MPSRRGCGSKRCAKGIKSAPQVVWLSDGGRGLWRLFEERFAGHATGHFGLLSCRATALEGQRPRGWMGGRPRRAGGLAWARHRLRHGMPDGVLADLADALDVEGLPDDSTGDLDGPCMPICNGIVSTSTMPCIRSWACRWVLGWWKVLVNGLFNNGSKGVGMRWSEDGFNHLLHLRLAWVNGRFETLFGLTLSPNK